MPEVLRREHFQLPKGGIPPVPEIFIAARLGIAIAIATMKYSGTEDTTI